MTTPTPTPTPIRDWLKEAVTAGHRPACSLCRQGETTCPGHAADAVLDACRRGDLIIMEREAADEVIAAAALALAAAADRTAAAEGGR
jgi:hypothetical protein